MKTSYLLPCQCGKDVPVAANQSGLAVHCECGAELTVPALRGLAGLRRTESVEAAPTTDVAAWGPRQGVVFLGLVILIGSLLASLVLWYGRPRPPIPPAFDEWNQNDVEERTPEELLELWEILREGPADPEWASHTAGYLYAEREFRNWLTLVLAVAVLGLVLTLAGLLARFGRRRLPAPPA
jgi:hypothetical protein